MKTPTVHYTAPYLLYPTNPITITVIGAGGNGSRMLTALAQINYCLNQFNHPGLQVWLWDDDLITEANRGRQLFAASEVGLAKAEVLISRINLFFGTNWKAISRRFGIRSDDDQVTLTNLYITCVDTVESRQQLAALLTNFRHQEGQGPETPYYWLDTGNGKHTGQVLLSTIGQIPQPAKTQEQTRSVLPFVTEEYKDLLVEADSMDDTPSCSLAEALSKQDLFINPALINLASSLLWQLFRQGKIRNRGAFLNLADLRSMPIKVG